MRVWIDQEKCTSSSLCEVMVPDVFSLQDDALAYVVEDGRVLTVPGGAESMATVPPELEAAVVDAAAQCPGECIFIEE